MKFIEKATKIITSITNAISGAGLLISAICLFLQVIMRELHITAIWTGEFARYGFMITVFFGFAAVTDKGSHLVITLFQDKMPLKFQQYYVALMRILFAVLFAVMAYGMLLAANNTAGNNQTFESFVNIKICYLYYVIFVGFGISALNALLSAIKYLHVAISGKV